MNWLDYLLIALLGFSALRSFMRGFTREIIGLCAAVAALVLGMLFYARAGVLLKPWITSDRGAHFAGFLLIVGVVLLLGAVVASIVRRFVKAIGLSFFDRLLGAAFGLVRGVVIAIALLTAWIAFGPRSDPKTPPDAVVHSQIAPYLTTVSNIVVSVAPSELKRSFQEVYDEARKKIDSGKK